MEEDINAIAIVGLASRLPGAGTSASAFWNVIREGRACRAPMPTDRVNIDAFYCTDRERPATTNVRHGYFLEGDMGAFDAPFFSIQPLEAESMDPQQRMMLEAAYHALENAGMPIDALSRSRTGVWVASTAHDFDVMLHRDPEAMPRYFSTGVSPSLLANRISWFFDLAGPSVNIDTACSGSLSAIHLACQSLQTGESDAALVGGVMLCLLPDVIFPQLSPLGFLSPDGQCHSFDSRANGYARGEGLGMVVLKRVSDAVRDGDTIRAVIRATAMNQDGRTPGITQPNRRAQTENILRAYQNARLPLDKTCYFEAHGTGTAVGDPYEAEAIYEAFRRPEDNPLYVGSVKANIGHLEAGAGIASVLKGVLMLENGWMPPVAGLEQLNPSISAAWNLTFPRQSVQFPPGLRRVSVNNFGYGGTNAHIVLDDAASFIADHFPEGKHATVIDMDLANGSLTRQSLLAGMNGHTNGEQHYNHKPEHHRTLNGSKHSGAKAGMHEKSAVNNTTGSRHVTNHYVNGNTGAVVGPCGPKSTMAETEDSSKISSGVSPDRLLEEPPVVLVLSSADEAGSQRLAEAYNSYLATIQLHNGNYNSKLLTQLAFTLSNRRSALPWKSYALVSGFSKDGLAAEFSKPIRTTTVPTVSFIFTGQGAQWYGMTQGLSVHYAFKKSLHQSAEYMRANGCPWDPIDELNKDKTNSRINEAELSQPLCTILQIALVDLLYSWGIRPAAVMGHSSGEIAAAYCLGALSHASAIKVAWHRGVNAARIAASRPGAGGMLAVALSEADVETHLTKAIETTGGKISVGCINSLNSVTISGDMRAIDALKESMDMQGIFAKKLQVAVAYHSHHMAELSEDYREAITEICGGQGITSTMVSSVTGRQVSYTDAGKPDYWVRNLVGQVRFTEGLTRLMEHLSAQQVNKAGRDILLEVGPHPALQRPIQDIAQTTARAKNFLCESTISRNRSALQSIGMAAGRLYCQGCRINLVHSNSLSNSETKPLVDLPPYTFNHSVSYWTESRLSRAYRFRKHARHELLGVRDVDWNPSRPKWRNPIHLIEHPWINDHVIRGEVIYPPSGLITMVIEAVRQLERTEPTGYELEDVVFPNSFKIPHNVPTVEAQIHFSKSGDRFNFQIFSVIADDQWELVCTGRVAAESQETFHGLSLLGLDALCDSSLSNRWEKNMSSQYYISLARGGYEYDRTFRSLRQIRFTSKGRKAIAQTTFNNWQSKFEEPILLAPHVIHPVDLDALFQTSIVAYSRGGSSDTLIARPTRISRLWIRGYSTNAQVDVRSLARTTFAGQRDHEFTIGAVDNENTVRAVIEGFRQTFQSQESPRTDPFRSCYFIDWRPDVNFLSGNDLEVLFPQSHIANGRDYNNFINRQELVCQYYMSKAIGFLTPERFAALPTQLQRYIDWMKICFEPKKLRDAGELSDKGLFDGKTEEDFLKSFAHESSENRLIYKLGDRLMSILRGETAASNVLFESGAVQRHLNESQSNLSSIIGFVDLMGYKHPGLRILEVGQGASSLAQGILERLTKYSGRQDGQDDIPRIAKYSFTVTIAGRGDDAVSQLEEYEQHLDYALLNLSKSPQEQGFKEADYDVIIVNSVIHSAPNLKGALENLSQLLKPEGKLIIIECTSPEQTWLPFVFGSLPGWWASEEVYRKTSPLLEVSQWRNLLETNGFDIDIELPLSSNTVTASPSSVFFSSPTRSLPSIQQRGIVIVAFEEQVIAKQLANELPTGAVEILAPDEFFTGRVRDSHCIVLVEMVQDFLATINETMWDGFKATLSTCKSTLWVTTGCTDPYPHPKRSLVTGLGRAVRNEEVDAIFVELALSADPATGQILKVFWESLRQCNGQPEAEYMERDGHLCIGRLNEATEVNQLLFNATGQRLPVPASIKPQDDRGLSLTVLRPGTLDTLCFDDDLLHDQNLASTEIEISVRATQVTPNDVQVVLGERIDDVLGYSCAGVVTRVGDASSYAVGDYVCACTPTGGFKTFARADESAVARLPENCSFTEAAGVTLAYITTYQALIKIARLQAGERLMIFDGMTHLGQVAIQVGQHIGAKVFTTVTTEQHLSSAVQSGILQDRVFSDHSSLAKAVQLSGGFDVVLHTGNERDLASKCTAAFGRNVELASRDLDDVQRISQRTVSMHFLNIRDIIQVPDMLKEAMMQLSQALNAKTIQVPGPLGIFPASRLRDVFTLPDTKHEGTTILEMTAGDSIPILPSLRYTYQFRSDATYVIAGGLGGLGGAILEWMINRGGRHFLLLSRSGGEGSSATRDLIASFERQGVKIFAPRCDITSSEDVSTVVQRCSNTMPPIRGCVQGAMVLRETLLQTMPAEVFHEALKPKVDGTLNLDQHLPNDLDFFVLMSSISSIIGFRGLGNYAAANAFKDAFAKARAARGQPCIALDLGPIKNIGVIADRELADWTVREGLEALGTTELFTLLNWACDPSNPAARDPPRAQLVTGFAGVETLKPDHFQELGWAHKPMLRPLMQLNISRQGLSQGDLAQTQLTWETQLIDASTEEDVKAVALEALTDRLRHLLSIPVSDIDPAQPILSFGIDSLLLLELRQWIKRTLQADISMSEMLQFTSLDEYATKITEKSELRSAVRNA